MDNNKKDAFFAEIENLSSYERRDTKVPVFYRFVAGAAALAAALCLGVHLKNIPSPADISAPEDMIVSETVPDATGTAPAVTDRPEKKTERRTTARPAVTSAAGETYTTAAVIMTSAAAPKTQGGTPDSSVQSAAETPTAVNIDSGSGTENTDPVSYYEYEGSFIMKKYTAFLASVVMLSNATSINANAQEYKPNTDYLYGVQSVKSFIEQNGESWLDLNSDGKFDIFDVYAFYSVENNYANDYTIPGYIQEKYDSMPTADISFTGTGHAWKSYYEYMWIVSDYDTPNYSLCYADVIDYFLSCNPPLLEYTDPNYYIDNCPDDYNDLIPHDLIRHDDSDWDYYKYRESGMFIREKDGQIRRITGEDVMVNEDGYDDSILPFENVLSMEELEMKKEIRVSHIHRFIDVYKDITYDTGSGAQIMKQLVERGIVDVDINSDGVFNFEDAALLAYASYYLRTGDALDDDCFLLDIAYPEQTPYHYVPDWMDFSKEPLTRSGVEKAIRFFDTASLYSYDYNENLAESLAEYCVTSRETDPKFFDFNYYSDIKIDFCRRFPVLENLGLYEELSIRFGPLTDEFELSDRMNFTREEINEAFPEYYSKVKSGELPKPDINLDGKIDDADFNILFNLECEFSSPYKKCYIGTMVRRYPEILPVIGVSQEIRDNFETNFDFNNNGISADYLETECMLMYIYGELDKTYGDTQAFLDAQQAYFKENPDIQYYVVFNQNHYRLSISQGKGWGGSLTPKEELDSIVAALADFNMDVPAEEGTAAPATPGDANIDTKVNIADAVSVLQYVSNKTKSPMTAQGIANADCDGVEGITGSDASAIQRIDAGMIS